MNQHPPILVTGAAGFIGFHIALRLRKAGRAVVGVDCLNDYYSVALKRQRLRLLEDDDGFQFRSLNVSDRAALEGLFAEHGFDDVVHMAAQAGVRYADKNPGAYVDSNLVGFAALLECCRHGGVRHLLYASSSSVYGANRKTPFEETDPADHPVSLYAATKRANELMAHSYSHLYQLPATGVRFFTVYGPWGRPDMAIWKFVAAILAGRPLQVFNEGRMSRDYTYIDDAVEGVLRLLDRAPQALAADDPLPATPAASATAPFRVYNIGNRRPVALLDLIRKLERCVGREARLEMLPMQPGDVPDTSASTDAIAADVQFAPGTSIDEGLAKYVQWHRQWAASFA